MHFRTGELSVAPRKWGRLGRAGTTASPRQTDQDYAYAYAINKHHTSPHDAVPYAQHLVPAKQVSALIALHCTAHPESAPRAADMSDDDDFMQDSGEEE